MKYLQAALFGVTIVSASALTACGSDEKAAAEAAAQAQRAAAARQAATPADPTARMAHAVVMGKSGAAVDLKYEVLNKPQPGRPTEIEIALIPGAVMDSMTVVVNPTTGLTVVSNAEGSFGKLATGEVARHKFAVLADRADVLYLTVAATAYAVGLSSTRTFAIPLIVTDPSAPAKADTGQKNPSASSQASK